MGLVDFFVFLLSSLWSLIGKFTFFSTPALGRGNGHYGDDGHIPNISPDRHVLGQNQEETSGNTSRMSQEDLGQVRYVRGCMEQRLHDLLTEVTHVRGILVCSQRGMELFSEGREGEAWEELQKFRWSELVEECEVHMRRSVREEANVGRNGESRSLGSESLPTRHDIGGIEAPYRINSHYHMGQAGVGMGHLERQGDKLPTEGPATVECWEEEESLRVPCMSDDESSTSSTEQSVRRGGIVREKGAPSRMRGRDKGKEKVMGCEESLSSTSSSESRKRNEWVRVESRKEMRKRQNEGVEQSPIKGREVSAGNLSMNSGMRDLTVRGENKVRVPSKLPKFRGVSGIKDAEEFLLEFKVVCEAHGLSEADMVRLLPLSLDLVNREWFEEWKGCEWEVIEREFLHHFVHPHTRILLQEKLDKLKQGSGDVQRYADEFRGIVRRMGVREDEDWVCHKFRMGLNEEIMREVNQVITSRGNVTTIREIEDIALQVEVNSQMIQRRKKGELKLESISNHRELEKNMRCDNCGGKGHKKAECPSIKGVREKVPDKVKNERVTSSLMKCFSCGESGHYSPNCPLKSTATCSTCGKKGHLAKVCYKNKEHKGSTVRQK